MPVFLWATSFPCHFGWTGSLPLFFFKEKLGCSTCFVRKKSAVLEFVHKLQLCTVIKCILCITILIADPESSSTSPDRNITVS